MEVRDPVHGSIKIRPCEVPVVRHPFFQRLRNIKQLGFSEYAFPGATHTRYLHSIGVMYVAGKIFDKVFEKKLSNPEFLKLKQTLKLACLLHDIGHAPLSHSTEQAMPMLSKLNVPERFLSEEDKKNDRQATHEDYTLKAITDSSFTESLSLAKEEFGITPAAIADLVTGTNHEEGFFVVEGVDYFPLLHQLVSSEMDCDRMDYLLRDSYFCGVSYGKYDLDWIIDNLYICNVDNVVQLGLHERAVSTFDDFLLSRFHMFLMVYFHYRAVCLEQMLMNYFKTSPDEYKIPWDIEEYVYHDDYLLRKVLRTSSDNWAHRVAYNDIPKKIFECFGTDQIQILKDLEKYLIESKIDYIKCSSKGRLSKYYDDTHKDLPKFPMKIVRTFHGSKKDEYFDIHKASNLYERFSDTHVVNRIHLDIEELSNSHKNTIYSILNGSSS